MKLLDRIARLFRHPTLTVPYVNGAEKRNRKGRRKRGPSSPFNDEKLAEFARKHMFHPRWNMAR